MNSLIHNNNNTIYSPECVECNGIGSCLYNSTQTSTRTREHDHSTTLHTFFSQVDRMPERCTAMRAFLGRSEATGDDPRRSGTAIGQAGTPAATSAPSSPVGEREGAKPAIGGARREDQMARGEERFDGNATAGPGESRCVRAACGRRYGRAKGAGAYHVSMRRSRAATARAAAARAAAPAAMVAGGSGDTNDGGSGGCELDGRRR